MIFLEKILGTVNVVLLKPSLYPELVFFFFSKIGLFTVFSTFDMDKLEKIRGNHWKERI